MLILSQDWRGPVEMVSGTVGHGLVTCAGRYFLKFETSSQKKESLAFAKGPSFFSLVSPAKIKVPSLKRFEEQ